LGEVSDIVLRLFLWGANSISWRLGCLNLNLSASDVPELSIEYDMLAKLKERVVLARAIDALQHSVKKENHEDKWLRETAEALEIDIEGDIDGGQRRSRKRFNCRRGCWPSAVLIY
jgi:hypothetical protein